MHSMSFYIVTPSRNQRPLLELCMKSVADQAGVRVHHHVQDGASTDGTAPFLAEYASSLQKDPRYSFSFESAADSGMYDAINRGWRRSLAAPFDVYAYLNCDEQYLPDALSHIASAFEKSSETAVCFGHVLVIDEDGELVCRRDVVEPNRYHVRLAHLPVFTAATFLRSRVLVEDALFFDDRFRVMGDAKWVLGMLDSGLKLQVVNRYLSTFVSRADNLALSEVGQAELEILRDGLPAFVKPFEWPIKLHHRLKKAMVGAYFPRPVEYDIHCPGAEHRTHFRVKRSFGVWRERLRHGRGR